MPEQTTRTIIVGGSVDDIYRLWANFENFPQFMKHIKSVTRTGERTSHWVAEGALGKKAEWDAETTRLEKNKRIAWNSKEGSSVKTSGQVTFNELPKGQTEVTVTMQYVAPAGKAGEAVAKLVSDLGGRLEEDLRNFKAYAEGTAERVAR
jgi:uncharacterized membrane protein